MSRDLEGGSPTGMMERTADTPDSTLDEPIRVTIMRDVTAVAQKLKYVMLPRARVEGGAGLRNWDLWGPLILCMALSVILALQAPDTQKGYVFSMIFVIVWLGSAVVTVNGVLIKGKISFFQSVCVLGYCVFPLVISAIVCFFVKNYRIVKLLVVLAGFVWSTGASVGFMSELVPADRRALGVRFSSIVSPQFSAFPHVFKRPVVPDSAFIHPAAVVEGDVRVGQDVSIWPMAVIRADVDTIVIGDRSNIQDGCVLHVRGEFYGRQEGMQLIIGEDVSIGHAVTLHACRIEPGTLIGIGSIILDGAVVQEGTIMGAGCVLPPGKVATPGLWIGNPARRLRDLSDSEKEMIKYNAANYVNLKNAWKEKKRLDAAKESA
ncbi:Yip1 member 6 [Perkinsus olseni]|uniref:Protein YIPF n=1 Tax=Perkinsus olseni TaxID=32597 RepID=A0A7J6LJ09_PEROL|nr:Yip1 member 6 [Perkinsus olseni]